MAAKVLISVFQLFSFSAFALVLSALSSCHALHSVWVVRPPIDGLLLAAGLPEPTASRSFYPIGIYGVSSTNDLATLTEAGFNVVAGPAERAYLEAARGAGLQVLASPATSAGPRFDPTAARRAVRDFDQHPALWAWYVC